MYVVEGYKGVKLLSERHGIKVFQAFRVDTNLGVILKILSKDNLSNAIKQSFFQEYEIAASHKFEHGLRTLGFVEKADYFLIEFELIPGTSLRESILIYKLKEEQVLKLALLMCDAIIELHNAHIIHKDINPSNFIVSKSLNEIHLIDYGLSEYYAERDDAIELLQLSHGNVNYIAPEQSGRINKNVDYRSDLYSLGICLYEFFTGQLPFEADDLYDILYKHIAVLPVDPIKINPKLHPKINEIILKLLSKELKDRYQSAYGLKKDLQRVLASYTDPVLTDNFELAQDDIRMVFNVSDELFGRDEGFKVIDSCFHNVCKSEKRILMIRGLSGIGKSSLVNAKTEYFYINKALFLQYKFDQYSEHLLLQSWIEVLKQIVKHICNAPTQQRDQIMNELRTSLGSDLFVLANLVPDFSHLFDERLNMREDTFVKNDRLYVAVSDLLSVVTKYWKALVLFFDDLQWSDQASLELIEYIMKNPKLKNILVIGAYRSNEIDELHPVKSLEDVLADHMCMIDLHALNHHDISQLLEHTLLHKYNNVDPLTKIIFEKSDGSPLYVHQFIEQIYDLNYLYFDAKVELWAWDVAKIKNMPAAENVIDLLAQKIELLNDKTTLFLSDAAILGNDINVELLSHVFKNRYDSSDINTAIKDGLLHQVIYRQQGKHFFVHDRIQEAFYQRLDSQYIRESKRTIARYLLEHEWTVHEKYLFMAKSFFDINQSESSKKMLIDYIEMTLDCVEILKTKVAYKEAKKYLKDLLKVVSKFGWENSKDHKILYKFYYQYALVLYINGEHKKSEEIIGLLLKYTNESKQKLQIFGLQKMLMATNIKDIKATMKEGGSIAADLSLEFPIRKKDQAMVLEDLALKIEKLLDKNDALDALPPMTHSKYTLGMRFLMDYWEVCYYDANEGFMSLCEHYMVFLTLKYGFTKESAFGYVIYGAGLASKKRYAESFSIGYAGIKLNHKIKDMEQLPKVHNLFCNYINPYVRSWKSSIELYQSSIDQSEKNGDIVFGIWAVYLQKWVYLFSGAPLSDIYRYYKEQKDFLAGSNDQKMIKAYEDMGNTIEHLHCQEAESKKFSSNLGYYKKNNFAPAHTWNILLQALFATVMGEEDKAYTLLSQKDLNINRTIIMFPAVHFHFLYALSLVKQIKKSNNEHRDKLQIKELQNQLRELKALSEASSENFLVPYLLVKAEASTLEDNFWESKAWYKLAVSEAKKQNSQLIKALCYEYYSHFLEPFDEDDSRKMLAFAYEEYENWEALGKLQQLTQKHGSWLGTFYKRAFNDQVLNRTSSYNNNQLNINSVFEAIKVISSELDASRLMEKLAGIMLMQSSAQELILVEPKKKGWHALMIAAADGYREIIKGIPAEIFDQVNQTKQMILVDDFKVSNKFIDIPFFRKNMPKSILAIPLLNAHDEIEMILFAQNNIISGAFSLVHQNVLQYLMRQASISLANAKLVGSLEKEVKANILANKQVDLLTQVVEQSPIMIMITKASGEIVYVNDAFMDFTGYSFTEVIGNKPNFLKSHIQHPYFYKELWHQIQQGKIWKGELINRKKDKSHYYEYQTIAPIFDKEQNLTHFIAFKEDISSRKEQEKLFMMQSRQAQMGEMLSMIAHQWRQPLNAINGITINNKLQIEMGRANLEKISADYNSIEDLVVFLSNTIDDFRNFFKPNKSQSQTDIKTLIERSLTVMDGVLKSYGIELTIEIQKNEMITTYVNEVVQVIMNLIKNTTDIVIEKSLHDAKIEIFYKKIEGRHILQISDNVGGIPSEYIDEVFLPYFSTKKEKQGTGLGLYMSKTIIEDHCKGTIEVFNQNGGATFVINLPDVSETD